MSVIDFFARYVKPLRLRGTGIIHTTPTGWVTDDLAAVSQLDVNFYLLKSEQGLICFDAGYDGHQERTRAELAKLNVDPAEVTQVFLTHGDVDHAGGLLGDEPLFANAEVYAHEAEAEMLRGTQIRFVRGFVRGPVKIRNPLHYQGPCTFLHDGQLLSVAGRKVQVLHVPGHTPGHCAYLVDDRILVSGDALAFNASGGYCFFDFFNLDTRANLDSLAKLSTRLADTKIALAASGHSGIYRGEEVFAHIDQIATGTKRRPFDPRAPHDPFESRD